MPYRPLKCWAKTHCRATVGMIQWGTGGSSAPSKSERGQPLNRKQKILLWPGVLIIVGMCLFPPKIWTSQANKGDSSLRLGHSFMFSTPGIVEALRYADMIPPEERSEEAKGQLKEVIMGHIDLDAPLLITRCFIVAILTGAGIATAKKRKST